MNCVRTSEAVNTIAIAGAVATGIPPLFAIFQWAIGGIILQHVHEVANATTVSASNCISDLFFQVQLSASELFETPLFALLSRG